MRNKAPETMFHLSVAYVSLFVMEKHPLSISWYYCFCINGLFKEFFRLKFDAPHIFVLVEVRNLSDDDVFETLKQLLLIKKIF